MMQPYCRAKVRRGEVVEECGRVLSTEGTCDREPRHGETRAPAGCNCDGEWWGGEHVTGCPLGPTRPRASS